MPNDTQLPDEIERDIARQRAALAGTLNQIADRASLDALLGTTGDNLRDFGQSASAKIHCTARDNPMAMAAGGAGLALLAFGVARAMTHDKDRTSDATGTPKVLTAPLRPLPMASVETQVRNSPAPQPGTPIQTATDAAPSSLRAQLSEGLETLGAEARDRVLAARVQAYEARKDLEAASRTALRNTRAAFDRNPIVFGLGAVAVGAAVASLLPRGREEIQRQRALYDQLTTQAAALFQEEKRKAMLAVRAAAEAGESIAKKAAADALDPDGRVTTSVPDAVTKIAGAAKAAYGAAGRSSGTTKDRPA
ncbi:MAG: DUF3618 domain-containing protein [Rhodobacteraceae bacterium]|nr:DUF3618 domain-containing protein [Paracoccaceae bacterium]